MPSEVKQQQHNPLALRLFPDGKADAEDTTQFLTASQALHLIKHFACGLDRLGIHEQAPNSILTPVIYLATIGFKCIFTAANPM